jgi:hypothetical protein
MGRSSLAAGPSTQESPPAIAALGTERAGLSPVSDTDGRPFLSTGAADDTVRRQSLFNMRRWFGLLKGSPGQPTP